ncbi:hypothetical protein BT69DRAFT_1314990 [Atractiella rhizophila]|nr:hypothetical protein BT69DRAFT_1314990 [Atractiella rhizophila]
MTNPPRSSHAAAVPVSLINIHHAPAVTTDIATEAAQKATFQGLRDPLLRRGYNHLVCLGRPWQSTTVGHLSQHLVHFILSLPRTKRRDKQADPRWRYEQEHAAGNMVAEPDFKKEYTLLSAAEKADWNRRWKEQSKAVKVTSWKGGSCTDG